MVALRLLCPVSIESRFSLIPEGQIAPQWILTELGWNLPGIDSNAGAAMPPGNALGDASGNATGKDEGAGLAIMSGSEPAGASAGAPDSRFSADGFLLSDGWNIEDTLSAVWIVGMLSMCLYALLTYLRLRKLVSTAVVMRDNIFQSEAVDSPFVLGVVRPRIYIPFRIEGRNLVHVVMHEQVHILRRDHWWKPLGFVLLSVYWFHPLMWLAYILLCRDIELACDERAIKELDDGQRADYSQALLDCSVSRRSIAACPLAFGETGVKTRVKSVLGYRKPGFWILALAVVACIVVAVCFLTDPARDSGSRAALAWARDFSATEVVAADLVVLPRSPGKEFKHLSQREIVAMTGLFSQSDGEYLEEEVYVEGGSTFFYFAMKDGTVHEIGNLGNTYLVIDGKYYKADYEWLASWNDVFPEGDQALPEGYLEQPRPGQPEAGQAAEKRQWDAAWSAFGAGMPQDTPPLEFSQAADFTSWGTDLTLHPDGSFEGIYYMDKDFVEKLSSYAMPLAQPDYEAGVDGEYPGRTRYYCKFNGRFDEITKINEYSYSMHLAELHYETEVDREWIEDGTRYIGAELEGLKGETFMFYLPDTPMAEMEIYGNKPPNFWSWTMGLVEEMSCYGIYNLETGYAFFASETEQSQLGQEGPVQPEPGQVDNVVYKDADLNRDGEAEIIRVRELTEGESYILEVLKQDGTVLWSEEAGTAHTGWNTILLCQSGGEDYLIRYHPNLSQGMGSYTCEQFTLEGGQEARENFWEADFELASALQTTGKMRAFAEAANEFLKNGTVLLSTWEGELVIGPRPASELQTLYPVRFGQEDGEGYPAEDVWAAFDTGLPEDTPPLEFIMATGASSMYTSLTLHPDGSFEGVYWNSENIAAEEYPRGTAYYCEFSGKFDEITKMDEYSFSMRLAELNCGTERDKVWIQDEIRYIGSEPFGVEQGETFRFYLPGVPLAELDEDFAEWSPDYYLWREDSIGRDESIDRMDVYGIYNVEGGYGFFTSWLD
ncbi:MAG: M56 family metallopeptidase [Lachnospiraceae bacterium]|nr:M56 family metallopeptidase [Lachnospiraceae bacterium]